MRVVPTASIVVCGVAAVLTAAILWFGEFTDPHTFRSTYQADGTWRYERNYEDNVRVVAGAVTPLVALGFLAGLCRRAAGTSRRLLILSSVVAPLGVAVIGWEVSQSWSRGKGLLSFFAWMVQCLAVAAAYVMCAAGWLFRRTTREADSGDEPSEAPDQDSLRGSEGM